MKSQSQAPLPGHKICMRCNADNALNMKFCRQCGTPLGGVPTPVPQSASGGVAYGQGTPEIPSTLVEGQPGPVAAPRSRPATPTPPPGAMPRAHAPSAPAQNTGPQQCPNCGGDTPGGFTFCQRCGKPLAARGPAAPGHVGSGHVASGHVAPGHVAPGHVAPGHVAPGHVAPGHVAPAHVAPASVQAVADAQQKRPQSQRPTPRSVQMPIQAGPAWAKLICVNRDGSDGESHELRGDYVELGRNPEAAIHFDDPYLAGCHARIERRGTGGARIVPLDKLNGVFRRLRQDITLQEGSVVLLGRELVRFELLTEEETKSTPLMQHGVSLFGSPSRDAWGRIMQLLPNGGIRDVRHLCGEEVVVGREEGDLVFGDDEFLSRRHAAFRWKHGQCVLSDLGSSNGTFIRLSEPSNLSDGDFLRIGDQMFRYKPE